MQPEDFGDSLLGWCGRIHRVGEVLFRRDDEIAVDDVAIGGPADLYRTLVHGVRDLWTCETPDQEETLFVPRLALRWINHC